jgi:hypothetical protein
MTFDGAGNESFCPPLLRQRLRRRPAVLLRVRHQRRDQRPAVAGLDAFITDVRTRADGSFGPLKVNGRKHYEFVLLREGQQTYHFYFEPFERTDRLPRLQISGPGGIADYVDKCPTHTAMTVLRGRAASPRDPFCGLEPASRLPVRAVCVRPPPFSVFSPMWTP